MQNILKTSGSVMLLACLSLACLTGCDQKSKLKLGIELTNKQCPMSMGTVGEISSITFDGTDVIYDMLMNEEYLNLDALKKNPDAMKSAVTAMVRNPAGEVRTMLEMVVAAKSGIRFIYKGKSTGKEAECYLGTEDLEKLLNRDLTEEENDRKKLEELTNVTNVSCPIKIDEATTLDKLTIEADNVVYNYTIDEKKVDIAALKSNEKQAKQNIKGSLNVSDASLRIFLESCAKANKGLCYRYTGDSSGKSTEFTFSASEIKELL